MLSAIRAAWARLSFAQTRAQLSRLWELAPCAARREAQGEITAGLERVEGPLAVNPMSGALFRAGRRLTPPPEAAGGEPCPTDWIVQTFPARTRVPVAAPIWFGTAPSLAAILTEALPRAIMLERAEAARPAVALVSLSLGRLDRMQEALAAGLFAPRALKVQAWDKLIMAERAWRPAEAPAPADLREAGRRLRAAFPRGDDALVGLVVLSGGDGAAGRLPGLAEAAAACGAPILDPDAVPLSRLIPALTSASRVLFGPGDEVCLALAAGQGAELARIKGPSPAFRGDLAAAALEKPVSRIEVGAASAWLTAGRGLLTD